MRRGSSGRWPPAGALSREDKDGLAGPPVLPTAELSLDGNCSPWAKEGRAARGLRTAPWTRDAGHILPLVNWVGALREPTFAHEIIYSCA